MIGNQLLWVHARIEESQPEQWVIFLQESCTDACSSHIVYAPVDFTTLNMVSSYLPDGPESLDDLGNASSSVATGDCILTTSIQIVVSHVMVQRFDDKVVPND